LNKKKLHILFLNSWYPSLVLPQNGDFIQRHAEAVALKHQITVIHVVTDPTVSKTEITDHQINEVRTLIAYVRPKGLGFLKLLQFAQTYFTLLEMVEPFDLIHVNRIYPAGLIGLFIKYKVFEMLVNQTNDETFNQLQQKLVYYKSLSDEAFIMADIEIKKQDVWTKQRRIRQQLNKFNMYELPNRTNRYGRRRNN